MMKQYETKKVNAIWLNSIPTHWTSLKFKKLFDEINIKNYPQLQLLVASQNMGVVPKNIYGKRTVEAQKDLDKLKLVMPDNFVISLRSFQGGIEYSTYKGIISPAYTILKQKLENNSLFFKYLFKSFPFIQLLKLCVTGIREGQNIDYNILKEHMIPIPPIDEQDKIVAYLDYHTSNINKLILNKRKQIELLEEYKKTKISEVVTKGLNPNVEMKDSGIDWIGQIPKNWKFVKFKYLFYELSIKGNSSLPLLVASQSMGVVPKKIYGKKTVEAQKDIDKLKLVMPDSFVISLRSFQGGIEYSKYKGIISPAYTILKQKYENNSLFFIYLFKSFPFIQLLKLCVTGIREGQNIDYDVLKNKYIPIPPLNEQREIADYLNSLTLKLDNLVDKHKLYIEKLEEYKKTLISDVVTGKIDIRDITIPKYKKVEIVDNIENNANIDELNME